VSGKKAKPEKKKERRGTGLNIIYIKGITQFNGRFFISHARIYFKLCMRPKL
jgi:hypothetical protein